MELIRNMELQGTYQKISKEIVQTKIFHGEDEDIIFNINSNPNNIKKDLLFFKDEILKEIKIFKSKLNEKSKNNEQYMNDKIDKFSIQIGEFNQKIIELSKLIVTDKKIREKVEQIAEFKETAKETIMTDEIKIDNLEKDFRIDNILKDTVLNPKIIGGIAKYNTFLDFMSKVTDELSELNKFKDKTISDINNYKQKLDNYASKTKLYIENGEKEAKLYTDKLIKKIEIKMNDLFG